MAPKSSTRRCVHASRSPAVAVLLLESGKADKGLLLACVCPTRTTGLLQSRPCEWANPESRTGVRALHIQSLRVHQLASASWGSPMSTHATCGAPMPARTCLAASMPRPFTDGVWRAPQAASRERPGCVWFESAHERISKHYLLPILKCLSASIPGAMHGFCSYGHSEYINRRGPRYGEGAWQDPPSRACGAATTTA